MSHSKGQVDCIHAMDPEAVLVPLGFGATRQLATFQHIEWALQQLHPHALLAVFEPKPDVVAKSVALRNPAELDEIRADRLRFWGQRAERLCWLVHLQP